MFYAEIPGDLRIIRRDVGTGAQRGRHLARGSGASATSTRRSSAGASARSTRTKSSDSTPRGSLHYACINASENASGFGSQNIGVRNRNVVPGNCNVKVVFEREVDRVLERNIKLTVMDQLIKPRRIVENGPRDITRNINAEWIMRLRHCYVEFRLLLLLR